MREMRFFNHSLVSYPYRRATPDLDDLMTKMNKHKLKHDFINSIIIINSITKSASSFVDKISDKTTPVTDRQIELFKQAMKSIQNEICNVDKIFNSLLDD